MIKSTITIPYSLEVSDLLPEFQDLTKKLPENEYEMFEEALDDAEVTATCSFQKGTPQTFDDPAYPDELEIEDLVITINFNNEVIKMQDRITSKSLDRLEQDVYEEWSEQGDNQ